VDVHGKIETELKTIAAGKQLHLKIPPPFRAFRKTKLPEQLFVPAIYFAGLSRNKFALKPARPC
jgi:hypothetical protein